jgi:hypothetical protein
MPKFSRPTVAVSGGHDVTTPTPVGCDPIKRHRRGGWVVDEVEQIVEPAVGIVDRSTKDRPAQPSILAWMSLTVICVSLPLKGFLSTGAIEHLAGFH